MPRRAEAPRPPACCEVCGAPIPPRAGQPAKTCSPACRRIRNNQREAVRYAQVKHTAAWQATRADYLDRLRARAAADPAFAEDQRARHRAAVQRWHAALQANPVSLADYLQRKRDWFAALPPAQREAKRQANRAWYAALSRDEKVLHYYERRREHALARLQALGETLAGRLPGRQGSQGLPEGADDARAA